MQSIKAVATTMLAILLHGATIPAFSTVKHLPTDVRASLKDASAFQIHADISAIPETVRIAFARAPGEEPFAMAQPGADWQLK